MEKVVMEGASEIEAVWIDPGTQRYAIVLTNRVGDWLEGKKHRVRLAAAALSRVT